MSNARALATRQSVTDSQLAQGAAALGPGAKLQRIETPFHTAIEVQVARDIQRVERNSLADGLSHAQRRYLTNGGYGGHRRTLRALKRRALLDPRGELTALGAAVAATLKERTR